MPTTEERTTDLLVALKQFTKRQDSSTGCKLGHVIAAGHGWLQVACDGLTLGLGDLWVAAHLSYYWTSDDGDPNYLRAGDRVILFTPDGDAYHLMCRVVRT